MGLISKEVEVNLGNNFKYYENLGYEIPRRYDKKRNRSTVKKGTKIKVRIEDLPLGSGMKVKVKCDECEKEYEIGYNTYNKQNHDGKIYCKKCYGKILISGENHPNYGGKYSKYGKDNHNYNPNKTDEERIIQRSYPEYVDFVKKVMTRDNHTCQCCGKIGNHDIEAHHLDGYDWCSEKRIDETNGITLCKTCHKNFHSIYGYGNNTKKQFEEWIGQAIEVLKYEGELPTARKIYCIEEDKIYDSATIIAKEWRCDFSHIYEVCHYKKSRYKSIKGKHLLWYDNYINMQSNDIENYLNWCNNNNNHTKIICITTNHIFETIASACKEYGLSHSAIIQCCKGETKISGILPNGKKLIWMYYDDYLNLSDTEIDKRIKDVENSKSTSRKLIICMNDLKVWNSSGECGKFSEEYYGVKLNYKGIWRVCQNQRSHHKGYIFKYIKDLTKEEYIKYDIENKLKELHNQELVQAS